MSGSDYTVTPNYGLIKPVPNADNDVWGDHLNSNADTLDGLLKTIQNTSGVTTWNSRAGAVTLNTADVTTVLPPSAGTPAMNGTATPGAVNTWSRGDHVHPTDTTRYAASNPAGYVTAAGAAGAAPVQSWNTRTGAVTLNATDVMTVLPPSSTTPVMDGTAAVGVGTTWARADHVHPTDTTRMPIAGTATNNNAAAGQVGEFITADRLTNLALTTNVTTNIVSVSLTAGDWDVSGNLYLSAVAGCSQFQVGTNPTQGSSWSGFAQVAATGVAALSGGALATGVVRLSLAATTTVWLVAQATFTSGTCNAQGTINARRAR